MLEIIGRLLLGAALRRANRTELGGKTMPYKLLLIPLGLLALSFVFVAIKS